MSDQKRPGGSRDISDLKARLGLKKPAAAPAARGNGGVVPPPGVNLPPPPGMAPAQPVIPNAADDPFGAMNAMAAVGTIQRAPEIVIVNDGRPVEHVGHQSASATFLRIGVPALIMLAAGTCVGRLSRDANFVNDGIQGAKALAESETKIKRQLANIATALDEHKNAGDYKPDKAREDALQKAAAALEVQTTTYSMAREVTNNDELAGKLIQFYSGVAEVKGMIDTHLKAAKADVQQYNAAAGRAKAAEVKETTNDFMKGQLKYAAVISAPLTCTGEEGKEAKKDCSAPFGVQIVELGPPVCGGKVTFSGKCPENAQPDGYTYRTVPDSQGFTQGDLITQGTDNVPSKKLLPLVQNPVLDELVKASPNLAAELLYQRRLKLINERLKKLIEDANKFEQSLASEASKGTRFSFFM